MDDKINKVKEKYALEISSINNRLNQLENGRVLELPGGSNMDGSLATNIQKLRNELNELFIKVINESESAFDELNVLFEYKKD